MLGERIRQARLACGLSLRELAERTGLVSAQAISKYERDLDVPRSDVLLRLADVLGVKVSFFFKPVRVRLSEPAYRKRMGLTKKEADRIETMVHEWLERYLELELVLDPQSPPAFETPKDMSFEVTDLDAIEEIATQLRQKWDLGLDPIDNLVDILEQRGVKITLVPAGDQFDSCAYWANDTIPVIAVKQGVPGDRQRFSISHELAHLLLDPIQGVDEEKAAHRFAAAFLLPRQAALSELGKKRSRVSLYELTELKRKYGMSMQALLHRMRDLDIISSAYSRVCLERFGARGWLIQEPGEQLAEESPTRFIRLMIRAVSEEVVSERKASELLNMTIDTYRRDFVGKYLNDEVPIQ